MSAPRARRQPVSCEPCRIRKIRCPRDAAPCGTCLRRRVPPEQCLFAGKAGGQSLGTSVAPRTPSSPISDRVTRSEADGDLAQRVEKIERLLHSQEKSSEPYGFASAPTATQRNFSAPNPSPGSESLCGALQTSAFGHVRFIPYTLGLEDTLRSNEEDVTYSVPACPFGNDAPRNVHDFFAQLPPAKECTELVEIYLTSFASIFHLLHDPTFRQQYECFLADPDSMPLVWLALLYSVLATGVLALPHESHLLQTLSRRPLATGKIAELAQRYRDAAMRCLEADHYLWNHNVTTLQTLIIMIYSISHSHGQTWTLIGLAHHLALSIGCHVDPDTFGLDAIESEERRRCWAALMMLYCNQNTSLGHIGVPHTAFHASSRPPADVDDDQVGLDKPCITAAPGSATQMTYLLLKFRLYDLCSEICEKVISQCAPDPIAIRRLDAAIMHEQRTWEARYIPDLEAGRLPDYHLAHMNILYSYGNHILLLLHHKQALGHTSHPEDAAWSRQRCASGSKRILQLHATLNESGELANFRWYGRGLGSFHALHAAVLLSSLQMWLTAQDRIEISILLRRCLAIFESIANSSTICTKAAPVLKYLLARTSEQRVPTVSSAQFDQDAMSGLNTAERSQQMLTPGYDVAGADWETLFGTSQPQQWLTPASLPWSHWEAAMSGSNSMATL